MDHVVEHHVDLLFLQQGGPPAHLEMATLCPNRTGSAAPRLAARSLAGLQCAAGTRGDLGDSTGDDDSGVQVRERR